MTNKLTAAALKFSHTHTHTYTHAYKQTNSKNSFNKSYGGIRQ